MADTTTICWCCTGITVCRTQGREGGSSHLSTGPVLFGELTECLYLHVLRPHCRRQHLQVKVQKAPEAALGYDWSNKCSNRRPVTATTSTLFGLNVSAPRNCVSVSRSTWQNFPRRPGRRTQTWRCLPGTTPPHARKATAMLNRFAPSDLMCARCISTSYSPSIEMPTIFSERSLRHRQFEWKPVPTSLQSAPT